MFNYIRDPEQITEESFRRINTVANLDKFDANARQIATRLIHTCGDPDVIDQLVMSEKAIRCGIEGVMQGRPVLCDVEMVRHGINRKWLKTDVLCFINHQDVAARAKLNGETRTMTALQHWQDHLDQSIVVIGNAPTALFRLLEMITAGASVPALIIGMPVGFVGAVESKQALYDFAEQQDIPIITLFGRRGGSALAAATLNAIARLV